MAELGKTLTQARIARGLTIDEVERDLRITKRYLEALEREEFVLLPAPVYGRGFLRSYARYLGLDSGALLNLYPRDEPVTSIQPLPRVPRQPTFTLNWIVAAAAVLGLFVIALVLLRSGGGKASSSQSVVGVPSSTVAGVSAQANAPAPVVESAAQPLASVKGSLPDLRNRDLQTAIAT